MNVQDFLKVVITAETGYFCLAYKGTEYFEEEWFVWPDDIESICKRAQEMCLRYDVYFSSYLFSKKSSLKQNVLPSATIQADLDEADINKLTLQPQIIVQTSPGRHQAYWILEQVTSDIEILSRKITYSIPKCDKSGWAAGRKVRLPNTFNYKYSEPQEVFVIQENPGKTKASDIEFLIVEPESIKITDEDTKWVETVRPEHDTGPLEYLESLRDIINAKVYLNYNVRANDRSEALWALMCECFRVGLSRDKVFFLAYHSVNNKFKDLKFHGERELAKDVLRAEQTVKYKVLNTRETIDEIRTSRVDIKSKREAIATLVIDAMKHSGRFLKTVDNRSWYIRNDLGRPVQISFNASELSSILYLTYGLNKVETEFSYTAYAIMAYVDKFETKCDVGALSYYKDDIVYIHTGEREVLKITANDITTLPNGYDNILFIWNSLNETIHPEFDTYVDWGKIIFNGGVGNSVNLTKEESLILLKIWLIFLIMRDAAVTRPILAFFGPPRSGKTTVLRNIYGFLYGRNRGITVASTQEDFDYATSIDPFYVMDNVDTPEKWLPDRLAQSISYSEVLKRQLYTDDKIIRVRRAAMLGLTAHSPRFLRADVVDRLLLFEVDTLPYIIPESEIISEVLKYRNILWGSLIKDIQKVLQTKPVPPEIVPQYRIQDFATIGCRIAKALGFYDEFVSCIEKIKRSQYGLNLNEDALLVSSIEKFIVKKGGDTNWIDSSTLWDMLVLYSANEHDFIRIYRDSRFLERKLRILKSTLESRWIVDTENKEGIRKWRFRNG